MFIHIHITRSFYVCISIFIYNIHVIFIYSHLVGLNVRVRHLKDLNGKYDFNKRVAIITIRRKKGHIIITTHALIIYN